MTLARWSGSAVGLLWRIMRALWPDSQDIHLYGGLGLLAYGVAVRWGGAYAWMLVGFGLLYIEHRATRRAGQRHRPRLATDRDREEVA